MRGPDFRRDKEPSAETSRLIAAVALVRTWRAELTAPQVAAMQSLDDARRADEISAEDAATIEAVIRRGHVHGAKKRLTQARRRHRQASS